MHKNDFEMEQAENEEGRREINDHSFLFRSLGGSGFLGQHIVRLIEERDPTVKEIRIVDLRPYENRLSKYQGGGKKRAEKAKHQTREKINFNPISGQFFSLSISHIFLFVYFFPFSPLAIFLSRA